MKAIIRQDIGWHDKAEDGSLTTRLALDTMLIQEAIGDKMGAAITALATFITGFALAFVYGWKLAFVMYVLILLISFINIIYYCYIIYIIIV